MTVSHAPRPIPEVRLRRGTTPEPNRDWSFLPSGLPESGSWLVTGVAGAGVTSLLCDTAAARIDAGFDPAGILVITASKPAAQRMRDQLNAAIAARALEGGFVSAATMVRSIHSVAFSLLRVGMDKHIRLIPGAEQDAVIRELLRGHAEDDRGGWPAELRPALTYQGFAQQLRDFLLRVAERGVTPQHLAELGRRHGRPTWQAAAEFLVEYQQTMALADSHEFSASELVAAALGLLQDDPGLIARMGVHTVLVDDAQHLDPCSVDLVRLLAERCHDRGDGLAVMAGDPAQSIFRFRGASPTVLTEARAERELHFDKTRRRPEVRAVVAQEAVVHRDVIADSVRRWHLIDQVPWEDIAVIVRQAGALDEVRRGLLAAGVPVHLGGSDMVLADQPIVSGMLLGLRALTEELSATELHELVLGPIGGADPITLRRLLRGLRRYDMNRRAVHTLAELIDPRKGIEASVRERLEEVLSPREASVLQRIREVLDAGWQALADDDSVEEVLWALWQATGLSGQLSAAALRGGPAGSQADRDLDAMMALFDAASAWVERRSGAGVSTFVANITDQEVPTPVRDRRLDRPQAVTVLTAHAVAGREFRRVVVAGVQDESWPALGETGSLFEQEEFVDLIDRDVDPDLPADPQSPGGRGEKLAEERRLFHRVALTRATEEVLVTAVDAPEAAEPTEPSRFIEELGCPVRRIGVAEEVDAPDESDGPSAAAPGLSVLSTPQFVAELRRAACLGEVSEKRRTQAIRQLARLKEAGVPGCDPGMWWDTREISDERELVGPGTVYLSPSRIEKLQQCPAYAEVARFAEDLTSTMPMIEGNLLHYFAEALASGVDRDWARARVLEAYDRVHDEPSWVLEEQRETFVQMVDHAGEWLAGRDGQYELLGAEVDVDVAVCADVNISGRIDRLERSRADGRARVIDLKTSKAPITETDAEKNPQLLAYQLAIARGEFRDDPPRIVTGSNHLSRGESVLVYPKKYNKRDHRVTTREQPVKSRAELDEFAQALSTLASVRRGPSFELRPDPDPRNGYCRKCALKPLCPALRRIGSASYA